MEAVRCLRALYPNKTILADTKCADAGGTVAKNCADAGADWMTVILFSNNSYNESKL